MLPRKLVKAGPSSHTIALPKEWVEKNKLRKGDVVYVDSLGDQELRITTTLHNQQQKTDRESILDITGKTIDSIQRLLTSAYVNNYNTIILTGEDIEKKTADIRMIVQDFVALEITDQSSKRITIKDLLNPREVSVEKTIRRMDMIVRSLFEDLKTPTPKGLHFQDRDINRLYFLLLRTLKSSLRSQEIAKELALLPVQSLVLWQIATQLENIADALTHIAQLIHNLKPKEKTVEEIISHVGTLFTEVMAAYYQGEAAKADLLAKKRHELENQLCTLPGMSKEFGEILQETRTMITHVCTIAKIVIDKE